MTWTTYDNITDWKVLPINYIDIELPTNQYTHYKLLDSSVIKTRAITDDNDAGGKTIVGYEIQIEFIPLTNKLGDLMQFLRDIKNESISYITLSLAEAGAGNPTVIIQTDDSSITIADWSIWWEAESKTDSEIKFYLQGIFSADLIDATTKPLFINSNM